MTSNPQPLSRFELVNGVEIHFFEWGGVSSPPMVCLHAAPLNAHAWDDFARAMAPHFHVICPDARGFGDSQWAESSDSTMVDDLKALSEKLGLGRFILIGNSMGGSIAFMYAAQHPDDVDRLVLVDTGPGPHPVAGAPPPRPPAPPPLSAGPFASPEEAAAGLPPVFGPRWTAFMAAHNLKQEPGGGWVWKFDIQRIVGGFQRSAMDPRRWPLWEAVRCPTLVLRGERSLALSQASGEEMISANPNASLVTVPDAAHFIAIEQPEAFEGLVREWLGV